MNTPKLLSILALGSALTASTFAQTSGVAYFTTSGDWYFDDDFNGVIDRTLTTVTQAGDVPLVGDWDGDGNDQIGYVREGAGTAYIWNLSSNNSDFSSLYTPAYTHGEVSTGTFPGAASWLYAANSYPRDIPVAGDWDGDGVDEVGLFRNNAGAIQWILGTENNPATAAGPAGLTDHAIFNHGGSNFPDLPLIGDPAGGGFDGAGLVRGNMTWITSNSSTAGAVLNSFAHGNNMTGNFDRPLLGDWDQDGSDEVMMFRQNTMEWLYSNSGDGTGLIDHTLLTDLNSVHGVGIGDVDYVFFMNTVPEPNTYALIVGVTLLGFAGWHRRRR